MNHGFGSDNHAPVHPKILASLAEVNRGHVPSYGTDQWTKKATLLFQEQFGADAHIYFVFNGTGANIVALKLLTKSFHSVLCTDISHINSDECGAPENVAGCKLVPVPNINGKLTVDELNKYFIRRGDQHFAQVQAISITQPTEVGTCYSIEELKSLSEWAKQRGLYIHIDGARFANASVYLKKSFKEMTTDLGVDVVSFGGTKNGLMMGEALIVLNKALAKDAIFARKQCTQLPSKSRFISTQFIAYLENDLWSQIAQHCHDLALYLNKAVSQIPEVQITHPTQSNAVFAIIPQTWVKKLRNSHFFYVWNQHTFECRWIISWDSTYTDADNFVNALKELSGK